MLQGDGKAARTAGLAGALVTRYQAPPRLFTSWSVSLAVQCAIIVPTYLFGLVGPSGIVPRHQGWGTALLWTLAISIFALYPHVFGRRILARAGAVAYVAPYLAIGAWVAWLAHLNGTAVYLFYLVLGNAYILDRRLGRRVGVAAAVIVYLEAYLLGGRSDPSIYGSLLPWIAGLVFTASTITLYFREQEARARSDYLLTELQEAHRQLQDYAEQVRELATVQERNRLAGELHDSVTQTLFSASLIADVLPRLWTQRPEVAQQRLGDLRQLTRGALAEMRMLLLELRPAALTQMGLGDLLKQLGNGVGGRAQLPIDVMVEGQRPLPPDVQVALYRTAQEALNNVVKYANATHVTIELRFEPQQVELRVRDDGQGFDPAAIPAGHLGLGIMRERAEAIGATLSVDSAPGRGTMIEVVWTDGQGDER